MDGFVFLPCWMFGLRGPSPGFIIKLMVTSCVSLLLFWVLVLFCFVCDLQDWSLYFPQSCVSLVVKSHWPSRSDSLGIPSPFVGSPRGTPDVGFTTVGKLLWYYCSPVCVSPTKESGIWFYSDCAPPTVSSWLLCLWMWGTFSGRFQHPPVNDCSTASCDFGVPAEGDEHTDFYSVLN